MQIASRAWAWLIDFWIMEWCRSVLQRVLSDISALIGEECIPAGTLEGLESQLELGYRELACLEVLGDLDEQSDALRCTQQALEEIRELTSELEQPLFSRYTAAPVDRGGSVGRPSYDIPESQLQFLLQQCRFTVPQVSMVLGVSIRTVRRRMEVYSLSVRNLYSVIPDDELDVIVRRIQERFGFCGNRQMQGHLLSEGIRVQQFHVRESQRRVDPGGVALRRLVSIKRRRYKVNGPLALWHIDGNHKLIRYVRMQALDVTVNVNFVCI